MKKIITYLILPATIADNAQTDVPWDSVSKSKPVRQDLHVNRKNAPHCDFRMIDMINTVATLGMTDNLTGALVIRRKSPLGDLGAGNLRETLV
jgi:hypothetical protein